mmetsp:Transcript_623/g.1491  ORF Transcript_623/g.1491 Transcript_623/m.1491 type:complete len:866 (+) Transcript_623:255-2852(+)
MPAEYDFFNFLVSSDLNNEVSVKIDSYVGSEPLHVEVGDAEAWTVPRRSTSCFATCSLCSYGEQLGVESRTRFAELRQGSRASWGERCTLSTKYRDLPLASQLSFTVWKLREGKLPELCGGATLSLFSKKGRLKTGRHRLLLSPQAPGDGSFPTSTPGKPQPEDRGEIERLERLCKRYHRGEVARIEWLDKLAFAELEHVLQQEAAGVRRGMEMALSVELPEFQHAVLHHQATAGMGPAFAPVSMAAGGLAVLHDPEVTRDNPAEVKTQKLARSLARGVVDRDLKPDTEERRRIAAILRQPPNRPLTVEQKGLLWRFRFSLTSDKSALTRFLKSVDWADAKEAKQAADLMQRWAPIDIADALELLSPDFSNEEVRSHAVGVLSRAEDDELQYYLLQLVQALRFEATDDSRLARFLIARAVRNPDIGIYLHWYLFTEWEDPLFGPRASKTHEHFVQAMLSEQQGYAMWDGIRHQIEMIAQLAHIIKELKSVRGGAPRKTERLREIISDAGSCGELSHVTMPNPLNPSVVLSGVVPSQCSVFKSALSPLRLSFRTANRVRQHAARDDSATEHDTGRARHPGPGSGEAPPGGAAVQGPWAHPRDGPEAFGNTVLIYKRGDDLRQDQLVNQIVSLMDRLLKKENLDLKLTLYKVLPTSTEDGLVEMVQESTPLSNVLAEHRTINRFLALNNPEPTGPFGLQPEALEAFVKSCAGYCVITYILGVGDRHLDNLMLCKDGRLFHIDFGFIMGRDPKPFPPPMKLCKEMVEAMGGAESEHYIRFRTYCGEAYNILRKNANLFLSLFHLMAGADLPDIKADPEKVMLKLQDKFRLDLDDEAAVQWIQQLINESASALMPAIMETTHRWAQYWR